MKWLGIFNYFDLFFFNFLIALIIILFFFIIKLNFRFLVFKINIFEDCGKFLKF